MIVAKCLPKNGCEKKKMALCLKRRGTAWRTQAKNSMKPGLKWPALNLPFKCHITTSISSELYVIRSCLCSRSSRDLLALCGASKLKSNLSPDTILKRNLCHSWVVLSDQCCSLIDVSNSRIVFFSPTFYAIFFKRSLHSLLRVHHFLLSKMTDYEY